MEKIKGRLEAHLPLLKEATKLSASSAFKVAKTLIFFGLFNLIFLIVGLVYLFKGDLVTYRIVFGILILAIGIGSTFLATTKTYQQVLIDAGKIYFDKLDVFKTKFAESLIDKLESGIATKAGTKVSQIINIPQLINSSYQNVPKIIAKGIAFLISKIPLIEYVDSINKDFFSQSKDEKVNFLVAKTDAFFNEKVFSINNSKIIRLLFFITFFIQVILIYFLKN